MTWKVIRKADHYKKNVLLIYIIFTVIFYQTNIQLSYQKRNPYILWQPFWKPNIKNISSDFGKCVDTRCVPQHSENWHLASVEKKLFITLPWPPVIFWQLHKRSEVVRSRMKDGQELQIAMYKKFWQIFKF